jgi:chemotaxis-related protein WspD
MDEPTTTRPRRTDCWQHEGVYGDRSCPELAGYGHCRNCPRYSRLGNVLLDREPTEDYVREWTELLAREKEPEVGATVSVVVFRIESEWLALATDVFEEATGVRPIHSVPHHTGDVLVGLTNVRGGIQLCVALDKLLGIEEGQAGDETAPGGDSRRLLVIERKGDRWAFVASAVLGIYRVPTSQFKNVPVTVAKSASSFTRTVFALDDRNVGLLDEQQVFDALRRSVC